MLLGAALVIAFGHAAAAEPRSKPPASRRAKSLSARKLEMHIEKQVFGKTKDGFEVDVYTLTNTNGLSARVMTLGATLISVETPDRHGRFDEITVRLDTWDKYQAGHPCLGSICGRYANRIAKGRFTLDGVEYILATNNGPNHLHGGRVGFDKRIWKAEPVEHRDDVGVKFSYVSPDGEEGYPGTLSATVAYHLTADDQLRIEYTAVTDRPTVVNLTNHTYWNLAGRGTALDHELLIRAEQYLPVDATLIPLGEPKPVRGTPMDFTSPRPIRAGIDQVEPGYDHCYVLTKERVGELSLCARVYEPKTGRTMEVLTTEPGVQLYTANYLSVGRAGRFYGKHDAFCLECQHFPDSPNRPAFPSTVLRPGQTYRQITVHRFGVRSP